MVLTRRSRIALVFLAVVSSATSRAADPEQKWYTITTPHFYIHYYRNSRHDLAEAAQKMAVRAEQAHAVLVPLLRHSPARRTNLVLTDNVEGANGSAQIVPRNVVRLYLTGADAHSDLNDYDDWLYQLFVHEYTHILHIDTIGGIPRVINAVLGKTWAPNQVQPAWVTEGIATFMESERTSGGRVRGSMFDMILRMAVLEGRFLRVDQISSNSRLYPHGATRYLYGCRFIKYIADRFGEDKLSEISHRYGRRPLPYAINRVAKEALGHSLTDLYADFGKHLKRHYALQVSAARARGLTPYKALSKQGEVLTWLRLSPDGRELIYTSGDGRSRRSHFVREVATDKITQRLRDHSSNGLAFTPDGQHVVASHAQRWRTYYQYSDLYASERSSGKSRRLTFGQRAREPDVSADGRWVVYVSNEVGKHDLKLLAFAGGQPRALLRGKDGTQFSAPRFDPSGKRVVVSRWSKGGYRDIVVVDVASGRLQNLTADRAQDLDPVFSADGERVYFSSDRTGVFNIYCYDLKKAELRQVTNVIGGAFWPAVSRDERKLYYVGYSAKGYDLHKATIKRDRFIAVLPFVNKRPPAPSIRPVTRPLKPRRYSPWKTILPDQWMLAIGADSYGTTLGFEVQGADIINRHSYGLRTDVSVEKGYPSYLVNYAYGRFWPTIGLKTSRFEGPRGGLTVDGDRVIYTEENYGASASVSLPVLRIPDHSLSLSLSYRFNWYRDKEGDTEVMVEPDDISPRLPPTGRLSGGSFGISYSHRLERYSYSISNERGRRISLNLGVNHEAFGSDFDTVRFSWAWAEYFAMPWLEQHVLALRLAGGVSQGDTARRSPFFIGGFPEQNVIEAVIDQLPLGGAYLRGYPRGAFYGNQYHLLNVEYRAPLFDIERGFSSLPIYFNHLHMAVFADIGNAFNDELELDALNVGVGAELLLEWSLFYIRGLTFRVGYARGLMEEGGNEFHFLLGNRF